MEKEEVSQVVRETANETAIALEQRLGKSLASQINELIKPLNHSQIEILSSEVRDYEEFFNYLDSFFLGWLIKRIALRKLKKAYQNEHRKKGESGKLVKHLNK